MLKRTHILIYSLKRKQNLYFSYFYSLQKLISLLILKSKPKLSYIYIYMYPEMTIFQTSVISIKISQLAQGERSKCVSFTYF